MTCATRKDMGWLSSLISAINSLHKSILRFANDEMLANTAKQYWVKMLVNEDRTLTTSNELQLQFNKISSHLSEFIHVQYTQTESIRLRHLTTRLDLHGVDAHYRQDPWKNETFFGILILLPFKRICTPYLERCYYRDYNQKMQSS